MCELSICPMTTQLALSLPWLIQSNCPNRRCKSWQIRWPLTLFLALWHSHHHIRRLDRRWYRNRKKERIASSYTVDNLCRYGTYCLLPLCYPPCCPNGGFIHQRHCGREGVIFKSAGAIEAARKTSHVVFDKTGTLTQGELGVIVEHYHDDYDESKLSLLLGLIGHSKLPVSDAISKHLRSKRIVGTAIQDMNRLTGRGMGGKLGEQILRAGNASWLNVQNHPLVRTVLIRDLTTFCFTIDGKLCAVFGLRDSLKDDALDVVTTL